MSGQYKKKKALYELSGGFCTECGAKIELRTMRMVQIKPRAEGGTSRIDNMRAVCQRCYDRRKRARNNKSHKERYKDGKYRAVNKYERKLHEEKPPQLCVSCQKACGGYDCEWANKLKPVKGWTATPTKHKEAGGVLTESYRITACPKYLQDPPRIYPKTCFFCRYCYICDSGCTCRNKHSPSYRQNVNDKHTCLCYKSEKY